jgi:hypothetical protein
LESHGHWAVILGVDLTLEVGKFTLWPALQLQRVVKYTSPGFEILWKFSWELLGWDDAAAQFRELYRMDPTFCSQVDPSGRGYLEVGNRLFLLTLFHSLVIISLILKRITENYGSC